MRIELVLDVPDIHDPNAVDAIRLGQEAARLARNDLHGFRVDLVHAAVGTPVAIPAEADFEDDPEAEPEAEDDEEAEDDGADEEDPAAPAE